MIALNYLAKTGSILRPSSAKEAAGLPKIPFVLKKRNSTNQELARFFRNHDRKKTGSRKSPEILRFPRLNFRKNRCPAAAGVFKKPVCPVQLRKLRSCRSFIAFLEGMRDRGGGGEGAQNKTSNFNLWNWGRGGTWRDQMSLRRTKLFHPLQEAIVRESLSHSMLIQVLYRLGSKALNWVIFLGAVADFWEWSRGEKGNRTHDL